MAGIAALATLLGALGPGPRSALAACALTPDLNYMGLLLATMSPSGTWGARWQGAHPLSCDGDNYVISVTPEALAALQRAAGDSSGGVLLVGEFPYIGDGTCLPGAVRRWWQPATTDPSGAGQRWEPTGVPTTVPTAGCPANQPGDAPLVVQPAG